MIAATGQSIAVILDEATQVGEARRTTASLAARLGFDATSQGKVALVATEAAGNLIKHAGKGELIVRDAESGRGGAGLEILALDSGPGMSDVGRCLSDGYSTAGSPGTGLGAIRRFADAFEIYSVPTMGTALWARLLVRPRTASTGITEMEIGAVNLPAPGELVCGDAWATINRNGCVFVILVDGLGHGLPAAEAAQEALRSFHANPSYEPVELLEATHSALRGTRGAAVAIARLNPATEECRYAGVGNISGVILDTKTCRSTSLVSQNGTVGSIIRRIQAFDYRWTDDSLLIMHSDGLGTQRKLNQYPGLFQRHPSLVAGVLYRDHKRGRDDVTIVAAGQGRREQP